MFSDSQLVKKAVFFGLEDTLISGKIDSNVNMQEVYKILSNLKEIEEQNKNFHMVLISGLPEEFAEKRIGENKLDEYFLPEKIFYVTPETVEEKEEIDKNLYLKKVAENPQYKDEFLKQKIFEKFGKQHNVSIGQMVFIGHDIWFDGFYSMKFSKIDFALLKESYSMMGEKFDAVIKDLTYINRTWDDVRDLILGKKPKPDLQCLSAFADKKFRDKLLEGTVLGGLSKIADANSQKPQI